MTYVRVMPRDLFNEGDLLNCLGRLWLKLDERRDHAAKLFGPAFDGDGFKIDQRQSDGSIEALNVSLTVGGDDCDVPLFRPLNARDKWPLYAMFGDEDVRVFDLDGNLSPEFWLLIKGDAK